MSNATSDDCTFTIVANVDNLLLRPLEEVAYRLIPGVMATGILMNLAFPLHAMAFTHNAYNI